MKVFGYATVAAPFLARTLAAVASVEREGAWWDSDGLLVESFGLFDNLMIPNGIEASGGELIVGEAADRWRDLEIFERCVRVARERLR